MLKRISKIILLIIAFVVACSNVQGIDIPLNNSSAQVYFSPYGGATEAIVKEIGKAKSEVLVQAYSFTSKDIAKALIDAQKKEYSCGDNP